MNASTCLLCLFDVVFVVLRVYQSVILGIELLKRGKGQQLQVESFFRQGNSANSLSLGHHRSLSIIIELFVEGAFHQSSSTV